MKLKNSLLSLLLISTGWIAGGAAAAGPEGLKPLGNDGRPLNLDFETGTLEDWTASGDAFDKQPIKGDTVFPRRNDMKSGHQGDYWIGTFEIAGDKPQGTLTSAPFKVTHPWASFLVGGGPHPTTKVELILKEGQGGRAVFRAVGSESETMRPVAVNLAPYVGKTVFIRLTDQHSGHWGHINFDSFRFHEKEPGVQKEAVTAAKKEEAPPLDQVQFAGLSPEEAAKAMKCPPGFSVKLFAGEPDVQQPIAFCTDDRGRLWVLECYTYPQRQPEGKGTDRILVLEDKDGDGRFDKRTVFIEGLNLATGIEYGFGGVWVGAAPYLLFIPVKEGDEPKPAGEPKTLLEGWAWQDTHETLNTFTWGPDGWLYGCHGVFTHSNVKKAGAPDSERQFINAGVWRYHPTRHTFEVFAEGTSNPWGIDFDENGQCFIEACVVPHFWHVIQGARYQRQGGQHYPISREELQRLTPDYFAQNFSGKVTPPIHPHIYGDIKTHGDHVHWAGERGPHAGNARSDAAGGGHAHAGLLIYQGDSWPQQYRGKIFMNNIHGQRINMDIPERKGSGFVGKHGDDFVNFEDRWSQVLNLISDQDGSVYLIDWYDKQQCHNQRDPEAHDRSNGRIFKIVFENRKGTALDLQEESDQDLIKLLMHPNAWYARHAQRILFERAAAGTLPETAKGELRRLVEVTDSEPAPGLKLRLIWAGHVTGSLKEEHLAALLEDKSEFVRAWAIQLLCEDGQVSESVLPQFARMAREDGSPFLRLYLASALQRIPADKRLEILTGLIAHAEDANDHNLPLMYWFAAEPLVGESTSQAVNLLGKAKIPLLREFITKRMTSAAASK